MNYLREINAFVDWLETNPLEAITQTLWFHLIAIANKCGWPEWFAVANLTLQAKVGVDKKTLIKHRNLLVQKGLIEYKNQGRSAGKYRLISIGGRIGRNTPLNDELKEPTSGNNPPNREPKESISGINPPNLPPNLPPIREPKLEPNCPPLYKLNKTKKNEENIVVIFDHWNTKEIILHRKLSDKMRGHISARLNDYSVGEIITAIDNYDIVLKGGDYFFSYRWKLDEFLLRGLEKFLTESDPLVNFRKDKPVDGQRGHENKARVNEQAQKKKEFIRSLYLS